MARLPAAPGAYGQPPGAAGRGVEAADAGARPAATLASAVPRVSWKWYATARSGCPAARLGDEVVDLVRHADADRVAEADLVDAEVEQPQPDLDRPAGSTAPVYGQPNAVET